MAFELKPGESIADLLIRAMKASTEDLKESITHHDGQGGEFGNMAKHLKDVVEDRNFRHRSRIVWTSLLGVVGVVAVVVVLTPKIL